MQLQFVFLLPDLLIFLFKNSKTKVVLGQNKILHSQKLSLNGSQKILIRKIRGAKITRFSIKNSSNILLPLALAPLSIDLSLKEAKQKMAVNLVRIISSIYQLFVVSGWAFLGIKFPFCSFSANSNLQF